MSKGRTHEHNLSNNLQKITTDEVDVTTVGYSGSGRTETSDIEINLSPNYSTTTTRYNVEAKKRSGKAGNRTIVMEGSADDESGYDELLRLINGTPVWGFPILSIKWDHREIAVFNAKYLLEALKNNEGDNDFFDARLTDSGSISMRKPTTDEWPSQQAGSDPEVVVAERLNLPLEDKYE